MAKYHIRNTQVFHDYYSRLKNIALSVFEWEGLPETCNARYLEETLYKHGSAAFLHDDTFGFIHVKCTASDMLNIYNEPVGYHLYAIGYDKNVHASDCVIVRNAPGMESTQTTIALYAERLANLDRAIEVNANAQKTPVLLRCDEKTRLTLEAIYRQYDGNAPVIIGLKSLQDKPLEAINTGAPFVADKLREEKRAVWNEVLEFLGLNTNPSDKKKERLIVNEVNANNEQIDIQAEVMSHERMRACEEINKKYGLNVSVKLRVRREETENGTVYDGVTASA